MGLVLVLKRQGEGKIAVLYPWQQTYATVGFLIWVR